MHMQAVLTALVASVPLIAAHGKVAVATGDAGGNGTALGIQGGVIPGAGPNRVTEPDTTVFKGAQADACGRTTGAGNNQIEAGTKAAMELSGSTLPQVTPGGYLQGTLHIVTTDGAGPYTAMLNTDGTGQNWQQLDVTQQVPGRNGNIRKTQNRSLWDRAVDIITKRATNVNEDYPFKANIPADAKCTGNINGIPNTCLVKMINPSNAGPFGGCIPVQMVQPGAAPAAPAAPARRRRTLQA